MRTMIAIPCMDQLQTAFVNCLFQLQRNPDDDCMFSASSLIYDARNKLGNIAVQNEAEFMLWLDSDIIFEPDLLDRMFDSLGDKDFITGLYFNRRPPYKPTIFSEAGYSEGEGNLVIPVAEHFFDYPKDRLFQIDACGFGCVLMKTKMFSEIFDKKGLPFSPILGFGEDISFCIRAKELGYELWCDPAIKVGHITQTTVTEELSEAWRKQACSTK